MYYTAIQSSTSDVLLPVCTGSRIKYSKHITYSMHILISVLYALHTVKWKKIYLLKIYRSDTHTICSTACTPFVEHRKLFLLSLRNSELLIYLQEYTENDFFIRKSRPGATSLSFNSFSIPNFLFVCCVVFFFAF